MQAVQVYLEWFRCNSFLKCVMQPKIAKNSLKTPIFGVQGRRYDRMTELCVIRQIQMVHSLSSVV